MKASEPCGKIRDVLGPTDPSKAPPGSIRREFGQTIMVNAAHASDSEENARREMGIVNVGENNFRPDRRRSFTAKSFRPAQRCLAKPPGRSFRPRSRSAHRGREGVNPPGSAAVTHLKAGAAQRSGLVLQPAAAVELQVDGLLRVGMGQALDQFSHGHLDSQLLPQLARQAGLEGLAGLAFASRKLPEPSQVRFRRGVGR